MFLVVDSDSLKGWNIHESMHVPTPYWTCWYTFHAMCGMGSNLSSFSFMKGVTLKIPSHYGDRMVGLMTRVRTMDMCNGKSCPQPGLTVDSIQKCKVECSDN